MLQLQLVELANSLKILLPGAESDLIKLTDKTEGQRAPDRQGCQYHIINLI